MRSPRWVAILSIRRVDPSSAPQIVLRRRTARRLLGMTPCGNRVAIFTTTRSKARSQVAHVAEKSPPAYIGALSDAPSHARDVDPNRILILDFGSQFTQLIARRIREERVYCEVHPPTRSLDWVREWQPKGIVLSGGPSSVYGDDVPTAEPELLRLGIPVLGVCYGMQLITHLEGGVVERGKREYGRAQVQICEASGLFEGFAVGERTTVWMSHGDQIVQAPPGYRVLGSSDDHPWAAFAASDRPIYGVQFHLEVAHTARGAEVMSNFLFGICGCEPTWTAGSFIQNELERIRAQVGEAT